MSQQELPGFNQKPGTGNQEPVTCLGMEFESDEARREYFTEELRKKLQDPVQILSASGSRKNLRFTVQSCPFLVQVIPTENQKPRTRNHTTGSLLPLM